MVSSGNLDNLITGEGVFTSYDGLKAEGTGALSFLSLDETILELRKPELLSVLPKPDSDFLGLFIQECICNGHSLWVIGLICKIKDYNNRPGILGVCVSVSNTSGCLIDAFSPLMSLFQSFDEHFNQRLKGKPISLKIGYFREKPERRAEDTHKYKVQSDFSMWGVVSDERYERTLDCAAKKIMHTPSLGRIFLFHPSPSSIRKIEDKVLEQIESEHKRIQQEQKNRATTPRFSEQQQKKFTNSNISVATKNLGNRVTIIERHYKKAGTLETRTPQKVDIERLAAMSNEQVVLELHKLKSRIETLEVAVKTAPRQQARHPGSFPNGNVRNEMPFRGAKEKFSDYLYNYQNILVPIFIVLTFALIGGVAALFYFSKGGDRSIEGQYINSESITREAPVINPSYARQDCINSRNYAEKQLCTGNNSDN